MQNNKKIIWIFGSSGAGKFNFINFVTTKKPIELLARFDCEISKKTLKGSFPILALNSTGDDYKKIKLLPTI